MRWSGIEGIYGETLRRTAVFGPTEGEKRYQDLHTRVTEHVSGGDYVGKKEETNRSIEHSSGRAILYADIDEEADKPTGSDG